MIMFYVLFLMIGGWIFSAIECPAEIEVKNKVNVSVYKNANGKEEMICLPW